MSTYTAFHSHTRLAAGSLAAVAERCKAVLDASPDAMPIVYDDATGRAVDIDYRGTTHDVLARLATPGEAQAAKRGPGRPKLGVVAREVTLLPRHWEWLGEQPGGASVTLRKLVDAARKGQGVVQGVDPAAHRARAAADRFMSTMLGNQPGYEEASRALYGGDRARFVTLSEPWPADLRDHARRLAAPAFGEAQPNVNA